MLRQTILLCAAVCAVVFASLFIPPASSVEPSRVYITAAHIEDPEGYTRIYEDLDTDYAVFIKEDAVSHTLQVGDHVKVLGERCKVLRVSDFEFSVDPPDVSKIVPGTSGATVTHNEIPIGFLSGWDGAGALRCIFY